ncbi:hypothetical protein J2X85_003871 [Microbacterium trichothecenolyticum]|uniref:DUF2000 domain-containing protein n=1 Tax=Microbacterium trichothecenolyticum TaxID=69370 RepID=UPI00285497DE|nr:DUF2000 domain-containing protein [Microbacterium trichothecenolyticum]MDR7186810.1 hypothetical protein [Microbacterium trichothecenolyticum]
MTAELTPSETTPTNVRFASKVVVLLNQDLAAWQELNVTAFLMSGIATSSPDLIGEPYRDGDGTEYLPMLREPVLVMSGDTQVLRTMRDKASSRNDVDLAIYTRELFQTGHDEANRAQVAAVPSADLDLVGIALRGPRSVVDRIVKGARLHD